MEAANRRRRFVVTPFRANSLLIYKFFAPEVFSFYAYTRHIISSFSGRKEKALGLDTMEAIGAQKDLLELPIKAQ